MAVAARFYVSQIARFAYNASQVTVTLNAAARGPENKAWATATPSGTITMNVMNEAAGKWFADRLGKDIAIVFDDADDVSP